MDNQIKCYLCGNLIRTNSGNFMTCDNCFKSLEAGTYRSIQKDKPKPKENNSSIKVTSANHKFSKLFFDYIGTVGGLLSLLLPPIVFIMSLNAGKSFKDSFIFATIIFGYLVFRMILAWLRYR